METGSKGTVDKKHEERRTVEKRSGKSKKITLLHHFIAVLLLSDIRGLQWVSAMQAERKELFIWLCLPC